MARLRLTLHSIGCNQDATLGSLTTKDLCISTDKETDSAYFQKGETGVFQYLLTLVDFSFKKKMYQPTEIVARIQLSMAAGASPNWEPLSRAELDRLFKFKKVTLDELSDKNAEGKETVVQTIGNDFYVHEVLVSLKLDAMYVTLKIYSLDKLMTLQQASRTFVAQKLGDDILKAEAKKYITPWTIDEQIPVLNKQIADKTSRMVKLETDLLLNPANNQISSEIQTLTGEIADLKKDKDDREAKQVPMTYSVANMQVLKYQKGDNAIEHIFPYLVQYNESFYDMLVRTANRWGEFVYYENGNLNIGYAYDEKNVTEVKDNYGTITYVDLESRKAVVAEDGNLDYAGADEKGFLDSTLRQSPNTISGTLFWPTTKKWDKVLMKEITAFLKNDKNIPTWIGNRLFDNTWDVAVKAADMKKNNDEFDGNWFPEKNKPCTTEHYGEYNFGDDDDPDNDSGVNLFSEINSKFKSDKYADILAKEQSVGRNAICIDFLTYCPQLKLGDVIKVSGELFIVVEVSSGVGEDGSCVFQVVATAQDSDDKKFYPAVLPAGHIRQSGPQVATIADAGDPSGNNRVRVLFPWQGDKDTASPWLTFTAGGAGSPVVGKHYEGDKVLLGFVDDNVERPYVMGCLTSKGEDADYIQTTPGGHKFKLQDDEDGIKNFLTRMFLPCVGTLGPFLTAIPAIKSITDAMCKPAQGAKNNLAMGGGFELSDNYGIYKISGSTDGREVAIASPWGDVNINAFTGITISAPNGDVTIKGKNIKLEAGNNLELISGTNVKNKVLGDGGKSGFFEDVAVAVAKKLAAKALNIVDLSMVRSVMEIIFRPAEGQLRIKSNRYLMFDAGKGDCVYPENAYASADDYEDYMKEQGKKYSRQGLSLSTGILEMLSRVQTLGTLMDTRYITLYNKCRQKRSAFENAITEAQKWAKDYKNPSNLHPKICDDYTVDALKNAMWADPATAPDFDKTKLAFVEEQFTTTDATKVPKSLIEKKRARYSILVTVDDDVLRQEVLDERKRQVENVVKAANEMRQAIIDFLKFTELDEKKDIRATARAFKDRKMPKNFMEALVNAFKKANLGDSYYFLPIDDDKRKDLKDLASDLTADITKPHRQVLKRKAAILLMEGMGFKDEWRKKVVPAAAPTTAQIADVNGATVTVPLAPPLAPPAPPAPQLEVKREFESAKLDDTYWPDYVKSIVMIPELKPDEWKLTKELSKMKKDAVDNLKDIMFWNIASENKSWGDNKHGAILFSDGAKVYNLDKEIKEIPAPPRGNLTDDDSIGDDVKNLLKEIRNKLTALN